MFRSKPRSQFISAYFGINARRLWQNIDPDTYNRCRGGAWYLGIYKLSGAYLFWDRNVARLAGTDFLTRSAECYYLQIISKILTTLSFFWVSLESYGFYDRRRSHGRIKSTITHACLFKSGLCYNIYSPIFCLSGRIFSNRTVRSSYMERINLFSETSKKTPKNDTQFK